MANDGKIIILNDKDSNKVKGFIKLDQFVDAYLLTSRFIDQKVLEAIRKSNIASDDYKSIELNLTLFGTEDAIWAKILKLIFLFDSIDPLNSKDLLIIPNSFANLAFSKVFNWCSETIWS